MCLLAVILRPESDPRAVVLANREESRARAAAVPQVHTEANGRAWLGGTDLVAGGTWLGLNDAGLLVAITNRRCSREEAVARSRGLLCRDLLACRTLPDAVARALGELSARFYNGFNLMFVRGAEAAVIEAGDQVAEHRLGSGIHLLTNGPLNDPRDGRIARVCEELHRLVAAHASLDRWVAEGQRICGLGPTLDQPAVCLTGRDRGTVSSTVIALTRNPDRVEYYFSEGPPHETGYDDYSHLARGLLARAGKVHRIQLRGPWQFEWIERENSDDPAAGESAGRVKLPGDWRSQFGMAAGSVRFSRRFHRPTNLGPGERVFVVFDGVGGSADVRLGGTQLGNLSGDRGRFEISGMLQESNELVVDVVFRPAFEVGAGGLWGPVSIEIVER